MKKTSISKKWTHSAAVTLVADVAAVENSVVVKPAAVMEVIARAAAVMVNKTPLVSCYTRCFCLCVGKRAVQFFELGGFLMVLNLR